MNGPSAVSLDAGARLVGPAGSHSRGIRNPAADAASAPTPGADAPSRSPGNGVARGGHAHRHHRAEQTAADAAASMLGVPTADLVVALRAGQSLMDVAATKGLSRDDLVGSIATALRAADPDLTEDRAARLAGFMADRMPPTPANNPWALAATVETGTLDVTA